MILEKPRNITQESERDLLGKVKEMPVTRGRALRQ